MDGLILRAEPRTVLGKKVKVLRRAGWVPGVVYGPAAPETVSVSVERREFERFFMANGHATLFTLEWAGGSRPVFIKEVQVDPVKYTPVHIDFFAPNLRKELTAAVPIVLHNPVASATGILTTYLTELQVKGLPTAIPHQIDADISGLADVGDALRVADLVMPTGVEAVTAGDEVVAAMGAATVETPEEVAEAAAAGEPIQLEAHAAEGDDNAAAVAAQQGSTTPGTATRD